MGKLFRFVFLFCSALLLGYELHAHDVTWWENPSGYFTSIPLNIYYPNGDDGRVGIVPESGEPCTVSVSLNPITSTLIGALVENPNPANSVYVRIVALRAPFSHVEYATLSGTWKATGIPTGFGCDATNPVPFSVTVKVSDQPPFFGISVANKWVDLNTGYYAGLQQSDCLTGPWTIIGLGQVFQIPMERRGDFFRRTTSLAGYLNGKITDPMGVPIPNINMALPYGGATATFDSTGLYSFPMRMAAGINLFTITNPIHASLNIEIPTYSNTVANFKVAMVAVTNNVVTTNACNCTPWCAIGYGSLDGAETPVYYSGGANPPTNGVADCGEATVTVTPPSGKSFTIRPGTGRNQNSGPAPASGVWTITTTVCSQSKSATVTVP